MPVKRVLEIFIASPSDLDEERIIVTESINRLNKIVREIDWHIDLYRWEDCIPGNCRPQDRINKDLDHCELFLGMLYKRWGQSTGQYSSGFEEEFSRAKKSNSEKGSPEIWIFFKKVDQSFLKDPGEQLKNVIKFREEREEFHDLFFNEFETAKELADSVYDLILKYLFEKNREINIPLGRNIDEIEGSHSQMPEKSTLDLSYNNDRQIAPLQLEEVIQSISDSLNEGILSASAPEIKIETYSIIRFYLLASSLASEQCTSSLLGTHEINLLFLHREKLELTPIEKKLLFRTLIGGSKNVVPGWYWFKEWDQDAIHQSLYYQAISDKDRDVRMNSIALLRDAKVRPNEDWIKDENIIRVLLSDNDTTLITLILSYVSEIGIRDDLELIDEFFKPENKSMYSFALAAKLSIISREDPNEGLVQILQLSSDLISASIIQMLTRESSSLKSSLLVEALEHYNSSIKTFAFIELERRGELTKEIVLPLLESSNNEMRPNLYKFLINQGQQINLEEIEKELEGSSEAKNEILFYMYNKISDEELNNSLDWFNNDGHIIYKVLCLRNYGKMKTRIVADLDNNFEKLYIESHGKFLQKYGSIGADILRKWENLKEFIRNRFIFSALSILIQCDNQESIRVARKYISSEDAGTKELAVRIIERYGDSSDAQALVNISMKSYGKLKSLAAEVALKLKPGITGVPMTFLLTNDRDLIRLSLKSLRSEPITKTRNIIEILLKNDNEFIRSQAILFLIDKLPRDELVNLLANYPKDTYYYNIMCWLDRVLYAPLSLKQVFREKLENEL